MLCQRQRQMALAYPTHAQQRDQATILSLQIRFSLLQQVCMPNEWPDWRRRTVEPLGMGTHIPRACGQRWILCGLGGGNSQRHRLRNRFGSDINLTRTYLGNERFSLCIRRAAQFFD